MNISINSMGGHVPIMTLNRSSFNDSEKFRILIMPIGPFKCDDVLYIFQVYGNALLPSYLGMLVEREGNSWTN